MFVLTPPSEFHKACIRGEKEKVLKTIENGIEKYDDFYWGLYMAGYNGYNELQLLMIENGIQILRREGGGALDNAIKIACTQNDNRLMILLIENGASIDACMHELTKEEILNLFQKGITPHTAYMCKELRITRVCNNFLQCKNILTEKVPVDLLSTVYRY